jgi:hypothetical protein
VIYKSNAIPIKIAMISLTEIVKKKSLKFLWKHKRPRRAKAIQNKESNAGSTTIPDSELIC